MCGCLHVVGSVSTSHCIAPWTTYRVLVSAVANRYTSPPQSVLATTAETAPTSPPISTLASIGSTNIALTVYSPLVPNGQIVRYIIDAIPVDGVVGTTAVQTARYLTSAEIFSLMQNTSVSISLAGLHAYTTYNISITSSTAEGDGPPLWLATATQQDVPPAMAAPAVTATTDTVEVQWAAASDENGPVLGYELVVNGDAALSGSGSTNGSVVYSGTGYSTNVDVSYVSSTFFVRAFTVAGSGPLSPPAHAHSN